MLATSVAVVRTMLDAITGSAPSRLSVSGTSAPDTPPITQLPTMAKKTTAASIGAAARCCLAMVFVSLLPLPRFGITEEIAGRFRPAGASSVCGWTTHTEPSEPRPSTFCYSESQRSV